MSAQVTSGLQRFRQAFGAGFLVTIVCASGMARPALSADIQTLRSDVKKIVQDLVDGCRNDFKSYCSSVTTGDGRLAFCLTAHADKRSSQCESALSNARREAEALLKSHAQSCQSDIASLCSGTVPGEGRIAKCLLDQRSSLSQTCGEVAEAVEDIIFPPSNPSVEAATAPAASEVNQTSEPSAAPSADEIIGALDAKVASIIEGGKQGCAADLEQHCATVTPGEGRLALCLIAHADKRTASCERALAEARTEAETLINEIDKSIQACAPDIASLCSGTQSGDGRIAQCLMEQRGSLNASCGQVLDKLSRVIFPPANEAARAPAALEANQTAEVSAAPSAEEIIGALDAKVASIIEGGKQGCAADLEKHCATVTPGEGRLALCLIAHADKRTASCERALAVARTEAETLINEIDKSIQACAPDIASLCSGTQPGDGRIAQCLMEQRGSLSASCGQVLDKLSKVIFPPANEAAAAATAPAEAIAEAGKEEANEPVAGTPDQKPAVLVALDSKVQAIIEQGKQGCAADLKTHCSTVTPGEGRLAFCLTAHADKRTASCETALAVARKEAEVLITEVNRSIEACSPDIADLCSGTEPGEGRIAQCLAEQRDALTESCGQVLDKLSKVIFPPSNKPVVGETTPSASAQITTGALKPAPVAVEKTCRSVAISVTDWGQDATKQDARALLKKQVSGFVARRGLQDYTAGGATVACASNLDLVVAGYYTCEAKTRVCWEQAVQDEGRWTVGSWRRHNQPDRLTLLSDQLDVVHDGGMVGARPDDQVIMRFVRTNEMPLFDGVADFVPEARALAILLPDPNRSASHVCVGRPLSCSRRQGDRRMVLVCRFDDAIRFARRIGQSCRL